MGVPKGEESKKGIENLFEEIMTKNFPNLLEEKDTPVQETQRGRNKLDPMRPTLGYIIIKIKILQIIFQERTTWMKCINS